MSLQNGFKAQAQRTTADVRDELRLKLDDRLDRQDPADHPGHYAEHLHLQVHPHRRAIRTCSRTRA